MLVVFPRASATDADSYSLDSELQLKKSIQTGVNPLDALYSVIDPGHASIPPLKHNFFRSSILTGFGHL